MTDRAFPPLSLACACLALILSGCAGGGGMPHPTAKNVEYAGRNGQVTTVSTLKVGRKLYISRCAECHRLTDPKKLTPADWPEMVERMAENAKINPDQQRAITQYLVSVSAAAHDTTSVPPAAIGSPSTAPIP
ncbi:MAG: diheme cytochrome c [Fibrobacterota bacterium]|nr:diheme cytochrome c [Fibrobacterota bacterium]